MNQHEEEREVFYIPPNFLTTGRIFGGMIRVRNAIEACVLVLLSAIPIIKAPFTLTVRVVLLILISLPIGVFSVVGIDGDSLSEFLVVWIRWLANRRSLVRSGLQSVSEHEAKDGHAPPDELEITIKETTTGKSAQPKIKGRREARTEDLIPVTEIQNGIVHLKDGRYIKILEVEPINFLLRSPREQRSIIASFASWLKISPVKLQIKVLTKKADISKHLNAIERDMEREENAKCRELQMDYYDLIKTIGSREAITRRFLLIFEYEPTFNNRHGDYTEVVSTLETAARTAKQYLLHCDNVIITHEDEDAFLLDVLYTIYNREDSGGQPIQKRIQALEMQALTSKERMEQIQIKHVIAPESIDLTHGSYICINGLYYAFLEVPSDEM